MVGLGLVAGAVLHHGAEAQVRDTLKTRRDTVKTRRDTTLVIPIPPHADSLLRDSLAKRDSIKRIPRDTIKEPLAHAESPNGFEVGRRLRWNRDSLFATGAITVADLLERVPGVTTFRAGWLSAPSLAAYMGDINRVRVFYDGIELKGLDPRSRGVLDLTQINLWSVEDAVIEPGPDEVRVYLRSWRVRNTTPETRTDVSTGDQQTNLYRGFFGRRFDNGAALQFGAQQYGTTPPSFTGTSSDQTGVVGRVGWAKRDWSVDAYATRISRHRGDIFGELDLGVVGDTIPHVESARTDAYFRVAYRDPDVSPLWAQVMAVASKYDYTGIRTVTITNPQTAADSLLAATSLDSGVFRSQYIASVGAVRGPLRLSVTQRLFGSGGHTIFTPSLRASFASRRLGVTAFAEGKSADSISHTDITAQFTPFSFVSLVVGAGRASDDRVKNIGFSANYMRAEAGLRLKQLWLVGGALRRDSLPLSPPRIFDKKFTRNIEPTAATGTTVAVRGQLWRLVNADVSAIRWNDTPRYFRPRYQTRSELFIRSNFLDRFPTGDFGLKASVVHEYRSGARFPVGNADELTVGYRTISTLLEIRILSATISWQFRNALGERYKQVPGFLMPRQTNFYGVRWNFFD
jgi:hypothetical protein